MERVLKASTAEELWDCTDGENTDGWTRVADQEGDSGRWMQHHTLVLHPDEAPDELYGLDYDMGLTENQEHELPWESHLAEDAPMPIYRVERREIVTVYYDKTKAHKS